MPVLARAFFLLTMVTLVVGGAVFGVAARRVRRRYDVPLPAIARATAPDEVARGARLFRTNCLDCHAGTAADAGDARRPVGGQVRGTPAFMGEIWAPNLTADVETGIGAWTDAELARLLRNGVRRDGRYAASMPRFARLADADVAALIGFLRSGDPLVAATRHQVPRPGLGVAGTLALAFAAGVDPTGPPRVAMPARGPSVDYGRYLATAVYGCVDCHTEGYGPVEEKLRAPMLLAGGQLHRSPRGDILYASNLTPDGETGLQGMNTPADLTRELTTGLRRDGLTVRPPMPVFRRLDDTEGAALLAYLRSVPPVLRRSANSPRDPIVATAPPARLFTTLGCVECHGAGAPNRAALQQATGKGRDQLVAAIRHPEVGRPDTQMPSYAAAVDDAMARRLAAWIQATPAKQMP